MQATQACGAEGVFLQHYSGSNARCLEVVLVLICKMVLCLAMLWQRVWVARQSRLEQAQPRGSQWTCERKQGAHLDPKRNSLEADRTLML